MTGQLWSEAHIDPVSYLNDAEQKKIKQRDEETAKYLKDILSQPNYVGQDEDEPNKDASVDELHTQLRKLRFYERSGP